MLQTVIHDFSMNTWGISVINMLIYKIDKLTNRGRGVLFANWVVLISYSTLKTMKK